MTEPRRIRAEGRLDAPLCLIGEAPGEQEERLLRPFVGASGHKLNSWWHPLGLRREMFRIDNVCQVRPPFNDLSQIADLDEWADDLHTRIAQLTDVRIIVPTGNIALRALMREDPLRVPLNAEDRVGMATITKYRGSIMTYHALDGRAIKMIPTIHPAAIYHQKAKKARGQEKANPGRTTKHCIVDWTRIAAEMHFPEVNAPVEAYYIVEEADDLAYWHEQIDALPPDLPITIDIENPFARDQTVCVGFAWDPAFAISIPLNWPGYEAPHPTWAARYALIKRICELPNPKVFQNGACNFDVFCLWHADGVRVANAIYDLKYMHHALDPVDDHDLAFMKSAYLRGEFHKDEAKGDKGKRYAGSYEAYLTYNAMDCTTQIALFYALQERLMAAGRWDLYETSYAPLLPALADMMLTGIRVSPAKRGRAHAHLLAECIGIQDRLTVLAGTPLHAKKDLANPRIKKFLYETLGLPPMRKRGAKGKPGAITTEEVAIRKLQLRYPNKCGEGPALILDHRRKYKLVQFLDDAKVDADERVRCVYEPVTEAGRLSSAKNPYKTGTNLQNQDRDPMIRGSYIPDEPDHVFVEVDCSQAESRIVYTVSGDDALYELALAPPDKFDTHSYNAALILGAQPKPTERYRYHAADLDGRTLGWVDFDQRYFGKRVEHGAQRGLGGDKMADELLKDGVVKTPEECQRAIDTYHTKKPGVGAYFEWIRWQIMREKALTNSWGFRWDVAWETMDHELYRRAYSLIPQSEVAFLLNTWGVVPAADYLRAGAGRLAAQVHDSVLVSMPADADTIHAFLTYIHGWLTQPRVYTSRRGPRELSMPVEVKIGRTWAFADKIEWKRLPERDEVEAALVPLRRAA